MLHFIPAWYFQDQWRENEQVWYATRLHTEFDDTVKQMQLFARNNVEDYNLILLNFAPNFRHFLHRQSVFHAPYFSIFDAICQIQRKHIEVYGFHDLKWPEHIEFLYTPFCIVAMLKSEKYAEIKFGEDGNMIQVDLFQNGKIYRTNVYDDRGFVSYSAVYEDGKLNYVQYLMENGVWKMSTFNDGLVQINPKANGYTLFDQEFKFKKLIYPSLEDVLEEVFSRYVSMLDHEDIFCIAMHDLHSPLLTRTLKYRKQILSFFQDRIVLNNNENVSRMLENASYIITDSKDTLSKINVGEEKKTDITPYDSRVDFGISSQLPVQNILFLTDHISDVTFELVIKELANYLDSNGKARVHLFTRNANVNHKTILLERVRNILDMSGFDSLMAREEDDKVYEFDLDQEHSKPIRFIVDQCVDELAISKTIREQRILLDLSENPDLYMQISCISSAIPQLVKKETQYIKDRKNGWILREVKDISKGLAYYLDELSHWNEAKIYSYELGKEYTVSQLVLKWKKVLEEVMYD